MMKSVFATYVMQLVERSEFQLNVPVAKQLPQPVDSWLYQRQPSCSSGVGWTGVLVFADALQAIVR
jgi:hypothetical protein